LFFVILFYPTCASSGLTYLHHVKAHIYNASNLLSTILHTKQPDFCYTRQTSYGDENATRKYGTIVRGTNWQQ